VLLELEKGGTNDDIAAALDIRPRTVKKHLENVHFRMRRGDSGTRLGSRFRPSASDPVSDTGTTLLSGL
jgi:FixJ family two-component response regulator